MKLSITFIIVLLFSVTIPAQKWSWKLFNPPNQPWTVLAPGTLTPDDEAKAGGNKGSYAYNDYNGFFAVVYRDASKRLFFFNPNYKEFIKDVRDGVAEANSGEIIKDTIFERRGTKFREVQVRFPSGTTRSPEGRTISKYRVQRFRMFFVGNRFYALLAVLPEEDVDKPEISQFLDSFSINTQPKTLPDSYAVNEDSVLVVGLANGVLANDSDLEKNDLTVSSGAALTNPAHGTLSINENGAFTYTPEPNYFGTDSFTYKANDGLLDSTPATVTINVKSVNDAPVISGVPVSLNADELQRVTFTATAADIDSPASSLQFSLKNAPAGASIDAKTGVLSWTPDEAQGPGNYNLQISVSDGEASANATVAVEVREVNVASSITNGAVNLSINELDPWIYTVQAADSDLPKQNLTFSLASAPGGAIINPNTGLITWTPTETQGDNSVYKFTVRVSDGIAQSEAALNIQVKEVNTAPRFNTIGNKMIDEEKPLNFTVRSMDADSPANNLTYAMTNAPSGANLDSSSGAFSWTPTESQGAGIYKITFRVTDNGTPALSGEETVNITVNEVNKPPVAANSTISLDEDSSVQVILKANDADLPANNLTYSIISQPLNGKLSGTAPNFVYQPNPNFNGTDSFTFKANDGSLDSGAATVTINVKAVNDAPVANADAAATVEYVPVSINVTSNDTDIDGDQIILTNVSDAVNGRVEIIGGEARFTPNPKFQGTGSFRYTVTDRKGGSATGTVTVRIDPAKPQN